MKILFIYPMTEKSTGPKSVIFSLSKNLIEKGHSVGIYTVNKYNKEIQKDLDKSNIVYYNSSNFTIPNIIRDVKDIKEYQAFHLHSIFVYKIWLVAMDLRKLNINYIITIHGNLMEAALKRGTMKKNIALKIAVTTMLKNARIIHALGQREKEEITKIVGDRYILVIPNGVEKIKERQIQCLHEKHEKLNILFIGRIDVYHKGIDLLLSAIMNIYTELKRKNVEIIIAGYYNKELDKKIINKTLTKHPEISEIVKFIGPVKGEEKNNLIHNCDIFIHTSRLEGMPMAVLEAMSFAKPCLVTRETNMEDIILNSDAGIVVNIDEASITKGLSEVSGKSRCELERMGANGFKWCKDNLQWSTLVDRYIEMYMESVN